MNDTGRAWGGEAAADPSARSIAPFLSFVVCCSLIVPYLAFDSFETDPRIAEIWPIGVVGFVWLTVIWPGHRRLTWPSVAALVLVTTITALAFDYSLPKAAWMGVANVGQAWLMVVIYRFGIGRDDWAPRVPRDLTWLLFATVGSATVAALLGTFPRLNAFEVTDAPFLWWVFRDGVFCFVGGATILLLWHRREVEVLPRSSPLNLALLVPVSALCLYGTYLDPSLPLSWLLIVPSVWGGLTLTPRGAASLALAIALGAAMLTFFPQNQFDYTGILPSATIVDMLIVASTFIMLLLALFREQRGRLLVELEGRRADADRQRRVLELVFDGMSDGLVIAGPDGTITRHNQAARQLLGRPIPAGRPESWSQVFGLRNPDGSTLHDDQIPLGAVFQGADQAGTELLVGERSDPRLLHVTARPLHSGGEVSAVLLFRDVTSERARLAELLSFAGVVAHDLRGPLTTLDGWIELAQDAHGRGDQAGVDDALKRAAEAGGRMHQVIEDWLTYTVVRDGELNPQRVDLAALVAEVVDAHRGGPSEPEFMLDAHHTVLADPSLLRQLLDNIVGNAVKYVAPGAKAHVRIQSCEDDEHGWVLVEVADDGIGVPAGEESAIFDEFHRSPAHRLDYPGTGLGLSLSKRIVTRHGGQITASRNAGAGSTFRFTLPSA